MILDIDVNQKLMNSTNAAIKAKNRMVAKHIVDNVKTSPFVLVRVRLDGVSKSAFLIRRVKKAKPEPIQKITKAKKIRRRRGMLASNVTNEFRTRLEGTNITINTTDKVLPSYLRVV